MIGSNAHLDFYIYAMAMRPVFSSRLTTILTMVGVAVGLGNVWRFPYMMGQYGGSAFLLVYLVFTILFAVPALIAEITLGRITRQGPIGAFRQALGHRVGMLIGYMLLCTILIASSYYVVVIANVLYTAYFSVSIGFDAASMSSFNEGLMNGRLQYTIAVCLIVTTLFVIYKGLNNGIEWVSKIFVPFFLVIILFLIYHTLTMDGAWFHFASFLHPNFSDLRPVHIFAALGQAVYSLSLGGTFMVVYGSYLSQDDSVVDIARWTAIGDVGAALLTSLFIVPAILVFQLDMTAGPTLIFSTLPHLFGEMPGGQVIGSFFLFGLAAVAFLSLIAALDVAQSCLKEIKWIRWDKNTTLIIIGIIEFILSYHSAMDSTLIGRLDLIFGSGMQVIGSGFALIALTWGIGKVIAGVQVHSAAMGKGFDLLFHWMKYVIPIILLVVLIGYIYSTIKGI